MSGNGGRALTGLRWLYAALEFSLFNGRWMSVQLVGLSKYWATAKPRV